MGVSKRFYSRTGPFTLFLLAAFLFLIWGSIPIRPAYAHRVTVFAWIDGENVHTQSKFSGGRPAKDAIVEVYDDNGAMLLSGSSDSMGGFSFKPPQITGLKIVLRAGSGHQGSWTLSREEIKEGFGLSATTIPTAPDMGPETPEVSPPESANTLETVDVKGFDAALPASSCLTEEEIQAAVEKALDRKLKPLLTRLRRRESADEKPDLTDILGGIGYIIGLMGIVAYVDYRKKARRPHDDP